MARWSCGVSSGKAEVVRVDDRYVAELVEFIRRVWDPNATAEKVRRAQAEKAANNQASPGEDVPTFLFLAQGRPIGHVTTIPVRIAICASDRPAHWIKGLWVLPEHRNGPVGFLLLKEAIRHLDCAMAMAVAPAARRVMTAVGFADLGAVPNFVRILHPKHVLNRIDSRALGFSTLAALPLHLAKWPGFASVAAVGAKAASWVCTSTVGRRSSRLTWDMSSNIDSQEFDALWVKVCSELVAAPVRDSGYLRWQYGARLEEDYHPVTLREQSVLAGFAIVRRPRVKGDPRLRGIRIATMSEAIFPIARPDIGLTLVAGAEDLARQMGADVLLCSASHLAVRRLLLRRAFVPIPGNVHFLTRDAENSRSLPKQLSDWWLTRGDGNADEIF